MSRVNNPKGKIAQFFCRHEHKSWYVAQSKSGFLNLRGEERYLVCEDCGKVIDKMFFEYEGMGFK